MRLGGYLRVSRVAGREGDRFLSPTLQRERIQTWCNAHGHELVEVREDLDVSGGRTDRDQLDALVEAIEDSRLDGLIVASLDRFGRSLPYCIALIDRIDKAGGQFVSVADGFDTRTPYGELALNVMLSFGQFELKRIREQWRRIVDRNIRAGKHPGATPPFGYERAGDGTLVPNEHAQVVVEIFRRAATGESISSIARDLAARHLESQRGQRITRGLIYTVLSNRAYLGEARFGDLVCPGAHPSLVDEALWHSVQEIPRKRPPRRETRALLAGLARCQGCRYVMSPTMREGRRRYKCAGNAHARSCPAAAFVTEQELVPLIEAAFFDRVGTIVAQAAGETQELEELTEQRDRAQRALADWRDNIEVQEALGMRGYLDGLETRAAALRTTEQQLSRAIAQRPPGLPDATELRRSWPEMDDETRGRMFAAVFDAVVIRKHPSRSHRLPMDKRVRLLPRGALGEFAVPRSGRDPAPLLDPFPWPRRPSRPWITLG